MPSSESGEFANYFEVGCNEEEIMIRFGTHYEDENQPTFRWTLITTPGYARQLLQMLGDTLHQQATLALHKRPGGAPGSKPPQ